jgi:hypothetical protein
MYTAFFVPFFYPENTNVLFSFYTGNGCLTAVSVSVKKGGEEADSYIYIYIYNTRESFETAFLA